MKNIWPFLLVGFLFLIGKKGNNILQRLQVGFAGIKPDWLNLRFQIILDIFNPLPTAIPISSLTGEIFSGSEKIGDFFRPNEIQILPGANQVEINLIPLPKALAQNFQSILNSNLNIKFTINSGPLSFSNSLIILGK
jgi:hypothetical protein